MGNVGVRKNKEGYELNLNTLIYLEIMDRDNFVSADKVKNAFLGLEYRCHTLMKVYSQSRDEMEKQVYS